jgi:rubredoxin
LDGGEMNREEEDGEGREGRMGNKGRDGRERGKEQGFRPNMRDLDAEWMCPSCGIEGEKGRKCVYVLAVGC